LTSLEGQNTAISNLCTLFSNLSNDVRSLTDFQGILAQKEGSSSDRGVLQLTENSNRNTESMLNAEIAKKQSYISTEQASLTAELNQANQIMQELPTELNGMNELDSAITGYNRNSNG
jgi:flagellar hook-associated protein 2